MPSHRSYNTESETPDEERDMICCGFFPVMTAAKVVAVYIILTCLLISAINFVQYGLHLVVLSIVCVILTAHSAALVYGIFARKRPLIVPFLIVQGICILLTSLGLFVFLFIGASSDFLNAQHERNESLRDVYRAHGLDPDDDLVRVAGSLVAILFILLNIGIQCASWHVIFRAYQHLDDSGSWRKPVGVGADGYMKGMPVASAKAAADFNDDGF